MLDFPADQDLLHTLSLRRNVFLLLLLSRQKRPVCPQDGGRNCYPPRFKPKTCSRLKYSRKFAAHNFRTDTTTILVLIVNDLPEQLMLMEALLRKAGYSVFTAEDGLEAFNLANKNTLSRHQ